MMNGLRLKRPSIDLYPSFLEMVGEMHSAKENIWPPYVPSPDESPLVFVQRLMDRETQPPPPLVPETIFWAVNDEGVVGRISLRHRLDGNLSKIGGHIGYEVRPSFRRRGIATEMLRQILLTTKAQEIGHHLLTCSPQNPASIKTIVNNGGVFEKVIFVDLVQEDRNHYWINVPQPPIWSFDENLRDILADRAGAFQYLTLLENRFLLEESVSEQVRILGELGFYKRLLGDLERAEHLLRSALNLVHEHVLGIRLEVQQKIRLSHVLQWKREFSSSNRLFDEIISLCRNNAEARPYLAFALQHAGKNCFDQKDFEGALTKFQEALGLRKSSSAPADQIASTELAITQTLKRLRGSQE